MVSRLNSWLRKIFRSYLLYLRTALWASPWAVIYAVLRITSWDYPILLALTLAGGVATSYIAFGRLNRDNSSIRQKPVVLPGLTTTPSSAVELFLPGSIFANHSSAPSWSLDSSPPRLPHVAVTSRPSRFVSMNNDTAMIATLTEPLGWSVSHSYLTTHVIANRLCEITLTAAPASNVLSTWSPRVAVTTVRVLLAA